MYVIRMGARTNRKNITVMHPFQCCFLSLFLKFSYSFNAWCPLKGHTYLNKPASLFKYVRPFSGPHALKGSKKLLTTPLR